jgi:hypothetical protein
MKGAKPRHPLEPWEELGFETEEAMLRATFGIPDDNSLEIKDAAREVLLEIKRGTKIEPIEDAKGNVVGHKIAGDL